MTNSYKTFASVLKALSDETRLSILDALSCGESCACDLLKTFDFSQPSLSYHMKILTDSGLVVGRKDGQKVHYTINQDAYDEMLAFLVSVGKNSSCCEQ